MKVGKRLQDFGFRRTERILKCQAPESVAFIGSVRSRKINRLAHGNPEMGRLTIVEIGHAHFVGGSVPPRDH